VNKNLWIKTKTVFFSALSTSFVYAVTMDVRSVQHSL